MPGLVELVEEIKPLVAKIPKLTTFEITTALGLLHFAREKADAAVIEVGLGGRLDATNIVTPRVSVITSLSFDHMAVLGSTMALIAGEKAGIIKPGIPVVSTPQPDEALEVLQKVSAGRHAALTIIGREVGFELLEHSLDGQSFAILNHKSVILRIPLLGAHQVVNAVTAYTALRVSGLSLSEAAIRRGFAKVHWPCRFEVVQREPPVVLDSAHNANSARRLRQTLDDYFPSRPVVCLFAILEDKDAAGMLAELKPRLTQVLATQARPSARTGCAEDCQPGGEPWGFRWRRSGRLRQRWNGPSSWPESVEWSWWQAVLPLPAR